MLKLADSLVVTSIKGDNNEREINTSPLPDPKKILPLENVTAFQKEFEIPKDHPVKCNRCN